MFTNASFINTTLRVAAMLILALAASACLARLPIERELNAVGDVLPHTIDYSDFVDLAKARGMVEIEETLAENNITIQNPESDNAYLRTSDLLELCGKQCSATDENEGWGSFLANFAQQKHQR